MASARQRRRQWSVHFRPTVAKWSQHLTLRVRLALLVALVVTLVVGVSTYLEMRSFERSLRAELVDTARRTTAAVCDDIELQDENTLANPDELSTILAQFRDAGHLSVRWISIVRIDRTTGQAAVYATTAGEDHPRAVALAKRALDTRKEVNAEPSDGLPMVIRPADHPVNTLYGAVVVAYSLDMLGEIRKAGRSIVIWFVPPAVIVLTLLVDLLARRMIHRPVAGMRKTMARVAAGDLAARAPVVRRDEIGEVAEGLNQMLAEMQDFSVALQSRVHDATEELRNANTELVASYQRVFALREALARAEQLAAVGQTAASVAHQIGTPLNLISGYVQMLQQDAGLDSRMARRLEIVQEQIGKMASVVRTMLDHARRPEPRQPTSIARMVQRVCDVARPKLGALGVELALSVDPEVPMVNAEIVPLELSLLNLITNSLDAMPGGGTLAVTVGASAGGVCIEVADTGAGIAPDLLPRVFEPWVTTKEAGKGSGLGLSITRDVVTAHGGTIVAESRPGAGARFTIELPRAAEPAATVEAEGVWRTS